MFLPSFRSPLSNTLLKRTMFRRARSFQSSTQSIAKTTNVSTIGLLIGATGSVALHCHSKVLNEAVNLGTINVGHLDTNLKKLDPTQKPVTSRFGGKLHYKQLCYGSLIGMFTGVVIGRLSSVLGFITLSTVLLLQFLQTRGIIHVPWTSIVRIGSDRVDLRQLFLEDPSFKLSFALTFLIAAFNI